MTKTMKILFTISIVINVLAIGGATGMVIKKLHDNPWMQAKRDLSPEGQKLMADSFDKMRHDMGPLMDEVQKTRAELRKVLSQEQFDAAKFDEVTAHIKDVRQQMGDKFLATTKDVV